MSSISLRIVLVVSTVALVTTACRTQPDAATPNAARQASNSALDVPIESIAASARGCAILDKNFPGLRSHAMYGFFKSMSLHQIAAMSKGEITPLMMAQAQTDLSVLTFAAVVRPVHKSSIDDLEPAPRGSQAARSDPQ